MKQPTIAPGTYNLTSSNAAWKGFTLHEDHSITFYDAHDGHEIVYEAPSTVLTRNGHQMFLDAATRMLATGQLVDVNAVENVEQTTAGGAL